MSPILYSIPYVTRSVKIWEPESELTSKNSHFPPVIELISWKLG